MAEISVIVPVYKVEKYLHCCIESILSQTFLDYELILIDDGSPDKCGTICDEYALKDNRVRVIHQKNEGVSAARNAGLDISSGKYIIFIDSDDYIDPRMLEVMRITLIEKNVDVAICGAKHVAENNELLWEEMLSEGYYNKLELLNALFSFPNPLGGCIWNKLVKAEKIRDCRYKKGISMAEDRIFLFEYFQNCTTAYKIPNTFYAVRERKDSATHSREISATSQMLNSSHYMMKQARDYSFSLGCIATVKYLDDCVRYIREIKTIRKSGKDSIIFMRYQMKMLFEIWESSFSKQISVSTRNGFLHEWLMNFQWR